MEAKDLFKDLFEKLDTKEFVCQNKVCRWSKIYKPFNFQTFQDSNLNVFCKENNLTDTKIYHAKDYGLTIETINNQRVFTVPLKNRTIKLGFVSENIKQYEAQKGVVLKGILAFYPLVHINNWGINVVLTFDVE